MQSAASYMSDSPPLLRRIHSLEFDHSPESEPYETADEEFDVHAAAQMIDSFDVGSLLDGVAGSFPATKSPRGEDNTLWMHELAQYSATGRSEEAMEAGSIGGGSVSETPNDVTMDGIDCQDGTTRGQGKRARRKPRKEEILMLRDSVKTLETRLEELKTDPPQLTGAGSAASRAMWKQAAIRQLGRRRKAEEDNALLRKMLALQRQEAKCLQRILKRRTKIQMMEDMLGMTRRKKATISSIPIDNSEIFTKLLSETDKLYADVDSHLAELSVTQLPCPSQKRKIHKNVVSGVVFEMTQRNMLPFGLRKAEKAARTVLNDLGTSGLLKIDNFDKYIAFHAQESKESRDTIATSYFSATPDHKYACGAQVRKVMRMYIEEDSAVFIWKMLAEPKLRHSSASIGYQLQSTLQVVMRPGETPTESTQLFIHFAASRHDLGLSTSAKFREPGHLDVGFTVWEKLVSCIHPEVESLLIDEQCARNSDELH